MPTVDQWYTMSKWLIIIGPIALVIWIRCLSAENRQRVGNVSLSMLGAGNPASPVQKVWRVIVIVIMLLCAALSTAKLVATLRNRTDAEQDESTVPVKAAPSASSTVR